MADQAGLLKRVRIGLGILAFPTVGTGVWAIFAPRSWYSDYGGGQAPPSAFGAYNEHFVQDLGGGFLAVGAALVFACVWPRRDSVRVALLAFLVHSVPHSVIHLIDDGELTRAGYIGVNASLLVGIVVALLVWWYNEQAYAAPSAASSAVTSARA